MKQGNYCMEYLVLVEDEDIELPLSVILTASIPDNPKGRVRQLRVTMEYDENE